MNRMSIAAVLLALATAGPVQAMCMGQGTEQQCLKLTFTPDGGSRLALSDNQGAVFYSAGSEFAHEPRGLAMRSYNSLGAEQRTRVWLDERGVQSTDSLSEHGEPLQP
ncbi:hypothetical protein [Geopseudomonas aromaticivorans]